MHFPIPIKAIVIDLDGTLLDTAPDLAHAAELMMAELGRPCPPLATIQTYIGNGVSRLVKRVLTGKWTGSPMPACSTEPCLFTRNTTENMWRIGRAHLTVWWRGCGR
jgi:hypothetical protein